MNVYAEAIGIMAKMKDSPELQKKFLLELVKYHPDTIIKAAKSIECPSPIAGTPPSEGATLRAYFRCLLLDNRRAQAVKEYRKLTKTGFTDAVAFIDSLGV